MASKTLIRRVVLQNYKSFAHCDVALAPLTFLVGVNGSGKSNFLDALRFVSDSLRTSLDHAIRDRGGIGEVRRRSGGHPNHFGIRLDFTLPSGQSGFYAFRIGAQSEGRYEVQLEECQMSSPLLLGATVGYRVEQGEARWTLASAPPAVAADRLFLVNASGFAEFRPLYDALSRMGFYNLNPDRIRGLQAPDAGELLARDGGNLASVLSESDGTLRALGVLVALFQGRNGLGSPSVSLVGIEEPEMAPHPGAAESLFTAGELLRLKQLQPAIPELIQRDLFESLLS